MQDLGLAAESDFIGPTQELLFKIEAAKSGIVEKLVDGGLEEWVSATVLTHWTCAVSGTSTINREAADVHGGTYSCRFDIDVGNHLVYIYQLITLEPGVDYTITFWHKAQAGKTQVVEITDINNNVYLNATGTAWAAVESYVGGVLSDTSWTQTTITFQSHPSYRKYYVLARNYTADSGTLYFDDFSITAEESAWINLTNSPNSGLAPVAPYDVIRTTAANWTDGNASMETIVISQQYRIRESGTIKQVELYTQTLTNLLTFKIRVWRYNGTTYDFVGESEDIAPQFTAGNVNLVTLQSPIEGVEVGDYYGFRWTQSPQWAGLTARLALANSKSYWKTNVAAWASPLSLAGLSSYAAVIPIVMYMDRPMAVMIGDSITQGVPNNYAFTQVDSSATDLDTYWGHQIALERGWTYQNMGHGSDTTSQLVARFAPDVLDINPRLVFLEGGINDILNGVAETTIVNNWEYMIQTAIEHYIKPIVIPILPCNGANTAQMQKRDSVNAQLEALAEQYGAVFIYDVDENLGQFRAGGDPGNLWDYKTGYNADAWHLNATGSEVFWNTILASLGEEVNLEYLKSINIKLGGAGVSPDPIGGEWSAELANPGGIFHPFHPTSVYADLLRLGREIRISIGAKYDGVDHYWQRLVGFMDAPGFDHGARAVRIGGLDYMKLLTDTRLRDINTIAESGSGSGSTEVDDIINGPLHWGGRAKFDSLATGGVGAEMYAENDACEIGVGEADDIGAWVTGAAGTVTSEGPAQESNFMLRFERDGDWLATGDEYCEDTDVAALTIGLRYIITFWGRIVYNSPDSDGYAILSARQGAAMLHEVTVQGATWTQYSLIVTAVATSALGLRYISTGKDSRAGDYIEIDNISVKSYDPDTWMKYELPSESNGPYFVVLDGEPVGQGDQDSEIGWHYELSTDSVYFAEEMTIPNGTDNLWVYYYTDQSLDDILADLLVFTGLYVSRAAALADLDYTPTGITLGRVWFDPGTTALAAVTKLCERVNYRFWFDYSGKPCFKPAPRALAIDHVFSDWGGLRDLSDYQDNEMVRNCIIIEGCERAVYQSKRDDKSNDKFKAELQDATSIATYLERTHSIQNHLFQDQASVEAMAIELLTEFKDPKWYADLALFANPVPLELGDVIQWPIQLGTPDVASGSGAVEIIKLGIIRDVGISDHNVSYKVEVVDSLESGSPSGSTSGSGSGP